MDRQILYEAMSKLGYPNKFIQSIKTLMENSIAKIIVNGKIGKEIKMERGIKQGCPLASFLYIIYIESLQLELQKNLITSRIGQEKIQTGGFIDGINIFVADEEDLEKIEKILENFETKTNSKINKNKTKIMGLGKWEGRKEWPLKWIKNDSKIKTLGIEFRPSEKETIKNLEKETIKKVENIIKNNNHRILTIQQRVEFVNTNIIPIIIHGAAIYPFKKLTTNKINCLNHNFVWNNKLETISKEETQLLTKEGGLGMVEARAKAISVLIKTMSKQACRPAGNQQLDYLLGIKMKIFKKTTTGPKKETIPTIFKTATDQAIEMQRRHPDINWKETTSKQLYEIWRSITPLTPKIVMKNPQINYRQTFVNLNEKYHLPESKEHIFQLVHDILPTKVRLKRIYPAQINNICEQCKLTPEDTKHIYGCKTSKPAVVWLMRRIGKMTGDPSLDQLSVDDILNLNFSLKDKKENNNVVNLIAVFSLMLWNARKKKNPNQIPFQAIEATKSLTKYLKN